MQVVHMSESSPGSTESGQGTGKEVEHILLVALSSRILGQKILKASLTPRRRCLMND